MATNVAQDLYLKCKFNNTSTLAGSHSKSSNLFVIQPASVNYSNFQDITHNDY